MYNHSQHSHSHSSGNKGVLNCMLHWLITWILERKLFSNRLIFPHRNDPLSCQTFLNPEDDMFCCNFLFINEKWLNSACFWVIWWQRKPLWTCSLFKHRNQMVLVICLYQYCLIWRTQWQWKMRIPVRTPLGKKAQNEWGLPCFRKEPSNCQSKAIQWDNYGELIQSLKESFL